MTAQNHQYDDQSEPQAQPTDSIDPIGPITLPSRSRLGARAMALVGTVGGAALGIAAITDGCSTWPTISAV